MNYAVKKLLKTLFEICLFCREKNINYQIKFTLNLFNLYQTLSQQTFVLMKTFEDVFGLRLQKTSWSRRIYSPYSYVFRRRLQDVFIKTNIFVLAIRLQNVLKTSSRRLQDIFKTSSRRFENVFKTSSRRFQDLLSS